jgi:hypothetical protein
MEFPKQLCWYHATRALGVALLIYGLVVDHTTDRGTILLGAFGLLGLDKVARADK